MAFEQRNNAGSKSRLFDGALRRAIAQDDGQRLRKAAEQLLDNAAAGEQWAIAMLADRLDGKAAQTVEVKAQNVEDLSLGDLKQAVAEALAGAGQAASGADESVGLH
jgi:hypothetical protein